MRLLREDTLQKFLDERSLGGKVTTIRRGSIRDVPQYLVVLNYAVPQSVYDQINAIRGEAEVVYEINSPDIKAPTKKYLIFEQQRVAAWAASNEVVRLNILEHRKTCSMYRYALRTEGSAFRVKCDFCNYEFEIVSAGVAQVADLFATDATRSIVAKVLKLTTKNLP